MDFQSADSANEDTSSGSDSGSMAWIRDLLGYKISYERPTLESSGELRYLTPLWILENAEKLYPSGSSLSTPIGFKLRAALKLLALRGPQHILIQFWSPHVVGTHQVLTTANQPFGLGVLDDGLLLYRRDSEHNQFFVDRDHEAKDLSPPARVFRRGLPEWTSDLTNYNPKDFPLLDSAINGKLHGYLALPISDSTMCIAVLELVMSSSNMNFAYEVQQIHNSLEKQNLITPQAFNCHTSQVPNEYREHELGKILNILKDVCDVHSLPLAQTWEVSPFSSYICHGKVIEKSCSSFNTRCIGKVCMSTTVLPFHVQDFSFWEFQEACRKQHLEKARGIVGKAMSSQGSCFCEDVTKLNEEEYPLVYIARANGLTGCFAVFVHSVEGNNDYVLEFFLPLDKKDVPYLVQTLKKKVEAASGFLLGDISSIKLVGQAGEASTNI